MIMRSAIILASALFSVSAAQAAADGNLASAILGCSALRGETAQLACYNAIAARLKADEPQVPAAAAPQTLVQALPAHSDNPESRADTTPRPVTGTVADFGKGGLRFAGDEPAVLDHITARVATVSYNYFHMFTVTLDNGQVWRQVDGDTRVARFKNDKTEVVTIARGFLDSFHLVIQGVWGDYAVKRVK